MAEFIRDRRGYEKVGSELAVQLRIAIERAPDFRFLRPVLFHTASG